MRTDLRARLDADYPAWRSTLRWDGDNRAFVVEVLLPLLRLDPDIRQVIRWAYGYDGEQESTEITSDGTTFARDLFFDGLAKDPHGVGHDYLHKLSRLGIADPSRRIWTFREAADWYRRAGEQLGDGAQRSFWRRIGLDIAGWWYWGRGAKARRRRIRRR